MKNLFNVTRCRSRCVDLRIIWICRRNRWKCRRATESSLVRSAIAADRRRLVRLRQRRKSSLENTQRLFLARKSTDFERRERYRSCWKNARTADRRSLVRLFSANTPSTTKVVTARRQRCRCSLRRDFLRKKHLCETPLRRANRPSTRRIWPAGISPVISPMRSSAAEEKQREKELSGKVLSRA